MKKIINVLAWCHGTCFGVEFQSAHELVNEIAKISFEESKQDENYKEEMLISLLLYTQFWDQH